MVDNDLWMATAPFYLQGEASRWWKGYEEIRGLEGMTWEMFQRVFLNEFFPESLLERKQT